MSDDSTPYALVVDDDALIRMDAADILENAGFRVFEAGSAEEALAILDRSGTSIQLLFTDVQMSPSELDGFYLARKWAAMWPHIGILMSSGMVEPDRSASCKGSGRSGAIAAAEEMTQELTQAVGRLPDSYHVGKKLAGSACG